MSLFSGRPVFRYEITEEMERDIARRAIMTAFAKIIAEDTVIRAGSPLSAQLMKRVHQIITEDYPDYWDNKP